MQGLASLFGGEGDLVDEVRGALPAAGLGIISSGGSPCPHELVPYVTPLLCVGQLGGNSEDLASISGETVGQILSSPRSTV